MPQNPSCKRCPLHATTSRVCIWGEGPKRADILLLGEAPGEVEERTGRPFVGQAGQQLEDLLKAAGLCRISSNNGVSVCTTHGAVFQYPLGAGVYALQGGIPCSTHEKIWRQVWPDASLPSDRVKQRAKSRKPKASRSPIRTPDDALVYPAAAEDEYGRQNVHERAEGSVDRRSIQIHEAGKLAASSPLLYGQLSQQSHLHRSTLPNKPASCPLCHPCLPVYITNPVRCRPPGNRDPTKEEIGACFTYLAEEIAQVRPKVIICMGVYALKALTGEGTVAKNRGRIIAPLSRIRVGDARIIASYHPAAYLHNHNKQTLASIIEDFRYAQNLIKGNGGNGKPTRILLPPPYSSDELVAALLTLAPANELACDLEWTAKPGQDISWPWTPGTEQLSISFTGRIAGKLHSVSFGWPPSKRGRRAIAAFIAKRKLIYHNAMADVIWLLHQGFEPPVNGDTMLRAYLLDESRRAALDQLAPLVAGTEPGWKIKPWHRRPESLRGWRELLNYNCEDTEATLLVHEDFERQMAMLDTEKRDNLNRAYYALLLPAIKPFARAALRGTPIDIDALDEAVAEHQGLMNESAEKLAAIMGVSAVAAAKLAGSPDRALRYFQEAGLPIVSTRDEELSDYKDDYPMVAYTQEYKHERKMCSTYLLPWRKLALQQGDGSFHSVYRLGSTRTGRTSAELEIGGSLQLAPRAPWVRRLVKARRGRKILAADYAQIEMRMVAWLGPERTMRRLFEEGVDLHTATAAFLKALHVKQISVADFWKERDKWMLLVTKEERQRAKGVNFGFLYKMQAPKFVKVAKNDYGVILSLDEAEDARNGFFELYSDLNAWHDRAEYEGMSQGFTVTPFGRYRTDIQDATKAINTPIQSTASDLTMFAMTIIDERLQARFGGVPVGEMKACLIGFVHDSVLVEADDDVVDEVTAIIKDAMEHPPLKRVGIKKIPVPLKADVVCGQNWADAA